MSRSVNPMRALKFMDLEAIAEALDINVATVYRWRKGDTSPKAIQVYRICSLLRLRPKTFAPYIGAHAVVFKMPDTKPGVFPLEPLETPTPEAIGEWVRSRIDRCRRLDWVSKPVLARRCHMDYRTARKCIENDEAQWRYLLRFIRVGLDVLPHYLLDTSATLPIPHIDRGFAGND